MNQYTSPPIDPTPEQIAAECAKIRSEWTQKKTMGAMAAVIPTSLKTRREFYRIPRELREIVRGE